MFTPQEVSEKTFPETRKHGYDMASIDEFLDTLTEDYTALYKENAGLKTKLKVLAEKVEEYRATEDAMRSTLLTAQKMAAKLVQEAQTEKDQILVEARALAATEIASLDEKRHEAEQKLAMAQQNLADFIAKSAEMCAQQTAFLQSLPELELAVACDDSVSDEDAAVMAIEGEITKEFQLNTAEPVTPEEPGAEDTAAEEESGEAEEAAAPANDDVAADFKLSLDELKFGRNYDSEN